MLTNTIGTMKEITGISSTVTRRSSNPILAFVRHIRKVKKSKGDLVIDIREKADLVYFAYAPGLRIQCSHIDILIGCNVLKIDIPFLGRLLSIARIGELQVKPQVRIIA